MKIDFANLQLQYRKYKDDIDANIQAVLNKSNFIMGEEVYELEHALEEFTGVKYAITCSSGTDALLLAMMALDIKPGDEIITTPFTFVATIETIARLYAKPVFVDIESDTFNIDATMIEASITTRTKAIMPVSLYGQPADMDTIQSIADKHNLKVIIDGAQSFGATYNGRMDSCLGDISTTRFFPSKPLGCYGDGGAVFTNHDEYAEKIKMLRVHGQNRRYLHKYIGIGGRLDTIQAAILLAKLPYYKLELSNRNIVAKNYTNALSAIVRTPIIKKGRSSAWAQYTIRDKNRDLLQKKLAEHEIPVAIHYPSPLHLQECYKYLGYSVGDYLKAENASKEVLNLPMNSFLLKGEIQNIAAILHE